MLILAALTACGMSQTIKIKKFQQIRDYSETFYWPCKTEKKFCSKTCSKRLANGKCKKWLVRTPLDINNSDHWSLLKNGNFILIKRNLVF